VEENPFRREHGLSGRFVVMYSGNLGLAHPFEAILDAAEQLQSALPQVLFLFVGQGPRLSWVMEQAENRKLANVRFLPFQPRENLQQSLRAADVHLASMRDDLWGLVVPSKVYGVLAAGRPCLFLGPRESEAAQLILREGCGAVVPMADGVKVAKCLATWATDSDGWRRIQARSRAVAPRVSLASAVEAFLQVFAGVVGAAANAAATPVAESLPIASSPGERSTRGVGRARREINRRFSTRIAKAGGLNSD
jgi:glycosyltransferase involved in cell wall biosynthesis